MKYNVGDRFIEKESTSPQLAICKISEKGVDGYSIELDYSREDADNDIRDCNLSDSFMDLNFNRLSDNFFGETAIGDGDFSPILSSINDMLNEKDKRYGNSALKPLEIFAKHHTYGSRIDEKLARVKNSDELRKNDIADIIGGLVLICRDKGWQDFSDQID